MDEKRQQTINDMRSMLDWLEEHPEVQLPSLLNATFGIYCWGDRNKFAQTVQSFGDYESKMDDAVFQAIKRFGSVTLAVEVFKEKVCRKEIVKKEFEEWVFDLQMLEDSVAAEAEPF